MNNITFIIGAGASRDGDAHFPVGGELIGNVIEIFKNIKHTYINYIGWDISQHSDSGNFYHLTEDDSYIVKCIKQHIIAENNLHGVQMRSGISLDRYIGQKYWPEYRQAMVDICDKLSNCTSIDRFISQQDNPVITACIKIAVTHIILKAESASWLSKWDGQGGDWVNATELPGSWYNKFFNIITGQKSRDELKKRFSNITLVIFNYDRCVELFIYAQLIYQYGLDEQQAIDLLREIKIYHPYGTVGKLPWEQAAANAASMSYAPYNNLKKNYYDNISIIKTLPLLSQQIATFNDANIAYKQELKKRIAESIYVVYLGFSFLNNENLSITRHTCKSNNCNYFATAYGVSDDECSYIQDRICPGRKTKHVKIYVKNAECSQFLDDYKHRLNF